MQNSRMTSRSIFAAMLLCFVASLTLAQSKEKEAQKEADAPPPPGKVEGRIEVVEFEPAHKPSPEVEALLNRLEVQAKALQSLQAMVRYDLNQLTTMDEQKRYGKIVYVTGPPAKFAVYFDTLRVDKKSIPSNRWYIFDGTWLVEKLEDKKQFFKWQVVAPGANPANANPLALGKGPFVVPVALRKDLILDKFKVAIAEPDAKNDPANSVHLILTPLKGRRINYLQLDLWYDKDSLEPQRARTINASDTETIIHLSDVKLNAPIEGDPMNTEEPKDKGWEVQINPWEGGK